jgi:uncharacterized protein (DUF427 family)
MNDPSTHLGPSPGAVRYPRHRIKITPAPERWIARLKDKVVAHSDHALILEESKYPRVVYFPPSDVETALLLGSGSRTTCPFKGEARYFAAEVDGELRDVAWYYPEVYDEVAPIAGHVAFYPECVHVEPEADDG